MTDQELVVSTLRKAGEIIGEYLEPGPRDAEATIAKLIAALDTEDLARAVCTENLNSDVVTIKSAKDRI